MNPTDPDLEPDQATLAALGRGIRKPGVPFVYTVGLALVATAMVLLPLVYLALVGAMGYAVYWHITANFAWLTLATGGFRFLVVKIFVYTAILAVGIIVLFFLLKPLFARRPKRAQPLALHPGAEPRLHAFIEAVCAAVGAPKPRRIDLDCHLNASAGFRRGYLSFFGGDLVLTLGLPLVANLTVDELAGVVAHEFGHFTQGLAMRLAFVIARVNGWFARVVFERDAWDQTLAEMSENPDDWRIGLVVWTAQLGIGLSRLLLRALMAVGVALSGFLSRQMEYHADACEIRLAGSENFERTTRKLATLGAALQHTYKGVRTGWQKNGRLPDDLPELLRRLHDDLPDPVVRQIHDTLGLDRTRWFDTHPCPAQRIRRARLAAQPGILSDDRPATALFERFDVPARQVTELHYTDDLGLSLGPDSLLPLAPRDPLPETESPPLASQPGSYRDRPPHPLVESLLLGTPELLLPLPLPPLRLTLPPAATDATAADDDPFPSDRSEPDPSELADWITRLTEVRPQLQELAARARAVAPCPIRFDDQPAPAPTEEPGSDPGEVLAGLRHAAREIAQSTARRLNLGLRLGLPTVEPEQRDRLQQFHDWLRAAEGEFEARAEFFRRIPSLAVTVSRTSMSGELPADLAGQVDAFRARHAGWVTRPQIARVGREEPRKLRIGPHADRLRELDGWSRETVDWFATYRFALQGLWEIAGRSERSLE